MDRATEHASGPRRGAGRDVLGALRARTFPYHRAVNTLPCYLRLFDADCTAAEYRALLGRLHGYLQAVEPALGEGMSPHLAEQVRRNRKQPVVAADLRTLGLSETALARLAVCPAVPRLESPARQWGTLYVLEGSHLAGDQVRPCLERSLGPELAGALVYYSLTGEALRAHWRGFRHLLPQVLDTHEALEEAIAAATETYETFRDWMAAL